jgi:hypothetical protein
MSRIPLMTSRPAKNQRILLRSSRASGVTMTTTVRPLLKDA